MRHWRKAPGGSAAAMVTLALGLGAGIAIFTALYTNLWQPLPYPHADALVSIWEAAPHIRSLPVSTGDVQGLAAGNQTLAGVGLYGGNAAMLTGLGPARKVDLTQASPELFTVLGLPLERGRAFNAADMQPGAAPVAVISNQFWRKYFNGGPALGHRFQLGGVSQTIVGILPAEWGAFSTDRFTILVPLPPQAAGDYLAKRYDAIGRLRPGVSVAAAHAEAAAAAAAVGRAHPSDKFSFKFGGLAPWRHRGLSGGPGMELGAAALLLLLACVNVSCLLLARVTGRSHEFAIRLSLGAGRGRIARQILAEGIALGLVGGVLAWWLAWALLRLLFAAHPPYWLAVGGSIATPVPLAFAVLLSLAAGIACSVVPAWRASRAAVSGGGFQAMQPRRMRGGVIALEVALALVLAVSVALFLRSGEKYAAVPTGFDASHVLVATIYIPQPSYSADSDASMLLARRALARARALPGVSSAALVDPLPPEGSERMLVKHGGKSVQMGVSQASPGYFATMGIRLLRGRAFAAGDSANAPKVAIINQALARAWWPGENPLGKQIMLPTKTNAGPWTVVGVAHNTRSPYDTAIPSAYFPAVQLPGSIDASLVLRTAGDPAALAHPLQRILAAMAPNAVLTVEPMATLRAGTNFVLDLFEIAGLLALALAIVGVYGTVSYWVNQRRGEMGVRLALGATRGRLMRLVVGRTLRWAIVGAVVGTAAAVAAARGFRSELFQVAPGDPASIASGVAILLAAAALAAYLPARRAARIDPVEALRHE